MQMTAGKMAMFTMSLALEIGVALGGTLDKTDTVIVCTGAAPNPDVLEHAQMLAFRIFRQAGVTLDWRDSKSSVCADPQHNGIVVSFSQQPSADFAPGALAYARPYEGVHIEIFYDRVSMAGNADDPNNLAYVLVHEITHVLQGVARHSDAGIMKATWDRADFAKMRQALLLFSDEDIRLIHYGLEGRHDKVKTFTFAPALSSKELR